MKSVGGDNCLNFLRAQKLQLSLSPIQFHHPGDATGTMKRVCYVMEVDGRNGSGKRHALLNRQLMVYYNGREFPDIYKTIFTNNRVFKNN